MKPSFNNFDLMPEIPYNIFAYLIAHNENLFKLLYYNTRDALSQPNLDYNAKLDMIYIDSGISEDNYNIFLKPMVGDELVKACSQLRIYKSSIRPDNHMQASVCYTFDILTGSKISMVDNIRGIPCNRVDLIEQELLHTLNGADIGGVGYLTFDRKRNANSLERYSINNGKNFFGNSLTLSVLWSNVDNSGGCDD